MNHFPILVVVIANAIVLSLGSIITHLVYRAARRTGDPDLRYLTAGFGFITASLFVGVVVHLLVQDVSSGAAAQAALTCIGFAFVLYSLWLRHRPTERSIQART